MKNNVSYWLYLCAIILSFIGGFTDSLALACSTAILLLLASIVLLKKESAMDCLWAFGCTFGVALFYYFIGKGGAYLVEYYLSVIVIIGAIVILRKIILYVCRDTSDKNTLSNNSRFL